jgi:hypothetical protein
MTGIFKLLRFLTVLSALIGAGMALWQRKDKVKQVWDGLGGAEGVAGAASKLVESAGPVRDLMNQVAHLKS